MIDVRREVADGMRLNLCVDSGEGRGTLTLYHLAQHKRAAAIGGIKAMALMKLLFIALESRIKALA
jgi:hypothetical protein